MKPGTSEAVRGLVGFGSLWGKERELIVAAPFVDFWAIPLYRVSAFIH